jgi:multiple sugar transport system permease protein
MIVSSTVTIICVFFGTLAAYALARLQFKHKKKLIVGMLSTRMLPTIALVIPFYMIVVSWLPALD